jgi:citrate synthase
VSLGGAAAPAGAGGLTGKAHGGGASAAVTTTTEAVRVSAMVRNLIGSFGVVDSQQSTVNRT